MAGRLSFLLALLFFTPGGRVAPNIWFCAFKDLALLAATSWRSSRNKEDSENDGKI